MRCKESDKSKAGENVSRSRSKSRSASRRKLVVHREPETRTKKKKMHAWVSHLGYCVNEVNGTKKAGVVGLKMECGSTGKRRGGDGKEAR